MTKTLTTALMALSLMLLPIAASADDKVEGTFSVSFEEVANNCRETGMTLKTADLKVDGGKGRQVYVTIPAVPLMRGTVSKGGKFKAAAKKGRTAIQGVDGRFKVQGRVEGTSIQLLFIAEYFQGTKPLCTQSWNAQGSRK